MDFPDYKVPKRSPEQNNAMHLYFEQVAEEMRAAGIDFKKALPPVNIPWSKEIVKILWKAMQQAHLDKKSTTELTEPEVSKIYDIMNLWLGESFGVHVPFPSEEEVKAHQELKKKL